MILAEAQRLAQVALEHHRRDPDDETLLRHYVQALEARDLAWLAQAKPEHP